MAQRAACHNPLICMRACYRRFSRRGDGRCGYKRWRRLDIKLLTEVGEREGAYRLSGIAGCCHPGDHNLVGQVVRLSNAGTHIVKLARRRASTDDAGQVGGIKSTLDIPAIATADA